MADQLLGYQSALERAAWFLVEDAGYLRLRGMDRIDFLQRQSTNDLRRLSDNGIVSSVLTSPVARILDVLTLIPESGVLGVITLTGRSRSTLEFLRKRIFFMDKVTLQDASEQVAQIELIGTLAGELSGVLGAQFPAPGTWALVRVDGFAVRLVASAESPNPSCRLLVRRHKLDRVSGWLKKKGLERLSKESCEVLRIEAGRPGADHELTEDYTPLEASLAHLISEGKGCYTGQEVLARQKTYDKVTRQLVGIMLSEPVNTGAVVAVEGRNVGTVTSAGLSPRFGPIALAIVRRPHNLSGTTVSVLISDGDRGINGTVQALPFEKSS